MSVYSQWKDTGQKNQVFEENLFQLAPCIPQIQYTLSCQGQSISMVTLVYLFANLIFTDCSTLWRYWLGQWQSSYVNDKCVINKGTLIMIMLTYTIIRKERTSQSGLWSSVHRLCYVGFIIQIRSKINLSLLDVWMQRTVNRNS